MAGRTGRSGKGPLRRTPEGTPQTWWPRSTAPPQRLQVVTNGLMPGAATDSQRKRARPHCHPTTAVRFRTARLTLELIAPQDRDVAHGTARPEGRQSGTHPSRCDRGSPTSRLRPDRLAMRLVSHEERPPNPKTRNPKVTWLAVRTPGHARHSHPKAKRTTRAGRPSHGTRGTHARPHTQTPTRTRPRTRVTPTPTRVAAATVRKPDRHRQRRHRRELT